MSPKSCRQFFKRRSSTRHSESCFFELSITYEDWIPQSKLCVPAYTDSKLQSSMEGLRNYNDQLVKTAAGWRISYRKLTVIHAQGDIGLG